MKERIHQIIHAKDIENFLRKKKVFSVKNNAKDSLLKVFGMENSFLWKNEKRNYNHLGNMIMWLRTQNEKNQNKEYYVVPNEKGENRSDKHFFVLTKEYIEKIQTKTWILTKDQRIKLEIAFLITQQAFSRKMRKDWFTPYFKHIKWVLDNVLMMNRVSFDQVMDAILHDNLEDIDYHSYNMLKKLFGTRIAEWVYALTEKKRYHRIWFLPLSKRWLLRKLVDLFTFDKKYLEEEEFDKLINDERYKRWWTKKFLKTLVKSWENSYKWLKELDRLPPTIESNLKKSVLLKDTFDKNLVPWFEYDTEYRDVFTVCRNVSEFAYLNKRLDDGIFKEKDELLPIKFSDRIHNLSTLWYKNNDGSTNFKQPSKRIAKLLETEYHFLNNTDLKSRLWKNGILLKDMEDNIANIVPHFMRDIWKQEFLKSLQKTSVTHYDVLKQQVAIIKEKDPKINNIMGTNDQKWESLYDRAKNLYKYQNDIIKEIQAIREKEKIWKWIGTDKIKLEHDYKRLLTTINQLHMVYEEMDAL